MTSHPVKLLIQFQSFSDVITNSSSTVFLAKKDSNVSWDYLENLIYDYTEKHLFTGTYEEFDKLSHEEKETYNWQSGLGGFISVVNYSELSEDNWELYYFKDLPNPENYFIVDLDWNLYATINWLCETFNAKCVE